MISGFFLNVVGTGLNLFIFLSFRSKPRREKYLKINKLKIDLMDLNLWAIIEFKGSVEIF